MELEAVSIGLRYVLFRPRDRQLVSASSRLRRSRFYFLALRLSVGLIDVATVPRRPFISVALGAGPSCARRVRVCV